MFSTFAATSDPNNEQIGENWPAVQEAKLPFECLNISNETAKMMALPESDKFRVWFEMFERENVDLF